MNKVTKRVHKKGRTHWSTMDLGEIPHSYDLMGKRRYMDNECWRMGILVSPTRRGRMIQGGTETHAHTTWEVAAFTAGLLTRPLNQILMKKACPRWCGGRCN